jgi:hypothetical protein
MTSASRFGRFATELEDYPFDETLNGSMIPSGLGCTDTLALLSASWRVALNSR